MVSNRDELQDRRNGTRSRRVLLADAAITVLARDGARGLTHRAVDRESHVPEGTTKNYHPTRQSLLEAIANRMSQVHRAAVERLRDTTPASATPSQLRMLYPALLKRAIYGDATQTLAMFELYLEAVRRPAIRAALGEMVAANARAVAELHRTVGLPTATQDTGLLEASLLGVLITQLALGPDTLATIGLDDIDAVGTELFDATTGYPTALPAQAN